MSTLFICLPRHFSSTLAEIMHKAAFYSLLIILIIIIIIILFAMFQCSGLGLQLNLSRRGDLKKRSGLYKSGNLECKYIHYSHMM